MRKLNLTLFLIGAAVAVPTGALAKPDRSESRAEIQSDSASKNCWGVVSSQLARTGGMGEHSSSFAGEPRLGLGNVARLFDFDHVSELGTALAQIDDVPETECEAE